MIGSVGERLLCSFGATLLALPVVVLSNYILVAVAVAAFVHGKPRW